MGPPLNRQELRARQDRFYADGRLRIEREAGHPERNVLVFVQCGPGFDAAYLEEPRSYDVLLNYYHEGSVHPKADIAVVQAGTKTTAIRRLMELRPDLLLRYQAVLFLDDDVEIGAEGIEALFRAMTAEKLDLAQPALTADSATAYPFLKRPSVGAGVMRVSSVEIMAPALTRRALESAKWVFAELVSGWGGDLLLGPAVRAACRTDERRGHRLGRRPARSARRPQPPAPFTPFCVATASIPDTRPTGSRSTSASNAFCGRSRPAKPEKLAERRLTERPPDHSETVGQTIADIPAQGLNRLSALALRPGVIGLTREGFPRS